MTVVPGGLRQLGPTGLQVSPVCIEPSRIGEITALMSERIPGDLWAELDALAVAPELWLN